MAELNLNVLFLICYLLILLSQIITDFIYNKSEVYNKFIVLSLYGKTKLADLAVARRWTQRNSTSLSSVSTLYF